MSILIQTCLVLAGIGFGAWIGGRDARKKPRDYRQPFRYWRE